LSKLAELSVTEAASKALLTILGGGFADSYSAKYYGTWQAWMREEYEYDPEDTDLEDNNSVWSAVMEYEGKDYELDGYSAKVVATYGGEGQGDQYWVVISISDGETTRYFRRDGWYASYDGGYLDGPTSEVAPKEKVITVFE